MWPSKKEVLWFDIAINEVLGMDVFYSIKLEDKQKSMMKLEKN